MAEQGQTPPKGKVDVFDVMKQYKDGGLGIDPTPSFRYMDQLVRAGEVDVQVDDAYIKEKYGQLPEYQQDPSALDRDIKAARLIHTDFQTDRFRPLPRISTRKRGLSPYASFDLTPRRSPYKLFTAKGDEWLDTPQRLAAGRGFFEDTSRESHPLMNDTHQKRNLYAGFELETDEYGRLREAPVLREQRYNESSFNLDLVSRASGYQPRERWWLGGFAVNMFNSAMELPMYGAAAIENQWGETSKRRLRTMAYMHSQYNSPTFSSTYDDIYLRGDLSMGAQAPVNWSQASTMSEEDAYSLYRALKTNEEEIRARAKEGDIRSKLDANIIDLGDGLYGHGALERLFTTANLLKKTSGLAASERGSQGAFDNPEAFFSGLGTTMGFMLPQMGLSRGAASLAARLGERGVAMGILERAAANGAKAVLTKAGERAVQTIGGTAPAMQMAGQGYDVAREAGYGHDEARFVAGGYAAAMMAAETLVGSQWMFKSYLGAGGKDSYRKMLLKNLRLARAEAGASRNAIGRAVAGSIEWLKGGSNNAWKNRAMNFGEAGLKETFQEAGEEFGDAMVEDMADMITGSMRFKEQRGTNYSLWSRVKEAGLMGGLSGGLMSQLGDQRRHAAPNDPSIWDAVQRGEGANVINAARALYDNKDITQKDLEVVQQDVDLATKSFEAFRDRNQGVYELMKKDGGILPMYGQLSATKRGLMAGIKSMKADPSALPENIAKKEAELKDVEEKLSKIENGHELVDRMKQGAVQAFMSESSRTKTISTESLDKILDWFAGAVDQFKNSAAERKALRETSKKNIANAIDAIADGKSVFEQVNALATEVTALATGKALSKEDASRVRNAMKAASEKILANLLATSGGQSQGAQMEAPSLLQDFTQLKDEASLTDAETISALEDDILAGKYGDDASKGYREYARSVLAESQLFGEESSAEAFIQGLPSDQSLDGTPSNSDIMFDMIRSSMERTMTYLKNKESVTQEEMDDIGAMVTSAVALPEAIALAKGPMQKVVESIVTPKAIDDYEGVRKLADDNDRIYKPASEISQEKLDALNEMANSIRSEHTRLGGVVDIRNKQLAHVERTDLLMRAAKCELYVSARPRTKNDAIASAIADVTKMRQALDNISPSAKPSEVEAATNALRKAVLVMEQQVYLELHNNVPFRAAVYNGMLNAFSDDRIQPAASYYWNLTVQKTYSFNQYHRPEILNPSLDPASPDARLISAVSQAAIQDITNWISRLSRVDPAIVYRAFEEYASRYGDQAPLYINQEQYIRAVEIASFLYNPDDKITNQLVLGRIKSNNEHWKDGHIPRSILLPGSQGVGKTTTIRSVIAVLEKMKGRKLKVAIVAPGTSNAVAVQENLVRSNSIEHSMVFGISDIAKIPEAMPDADVVIFDEAHVISTDIAEKVRDVMRKMDRSAGLFLGDHRQVPSMVDLGSMLPIESRMMRTMPLTVSFRHTDVEMIHVLEKLEGQVQKAISQDWKEGQLPSMDETRYTADGRSGVRLFQSIDEVAQSFADETIANPTIDSFLIVLNDAARLSMISKLEKNVELMSAIGQQGLSNRVRMMGQGEHSVLGLEAERVFVAFGPEGLGSSYTRFLYTAMGRSKGSVSAFFPTGRSRQVPELRRSVINTNERAQRTALMKSRIRFDSNSIAPVKSEASAEEESAAPTPAPPPAPDQNDAANSEMQGGVVYLKQDEVPSDKPHLVGMALTIISVTNEGGNISYEVQLPNGEVMRVGADQVQESAPERKIDSDLKSETKEEEPKTPNNENEARDVNPSSSGNRTRLQELYESGRSLAIFTGSMPAVDDSGEPTAFNKSSELFRYRAELLKLLKGYHLPVKFIVRKNVKYNTGADQGRDETPYGNLSIQIHFDINDDTRQQVEAVMQEAMRKAGISLDVKTDTLSSFTMLGSAPAMTKSLNSRFDAYLAQLYQKASALNDGDVLPGYESLQAVQVTQMSVGEPGMAAKNYRVDGGFLPGILYRGKPEQYDVQIPLSELLRKVQEKGGVHSSPRVDGNNYVIDVTSIPGLPPTRVPLQALPIAEDFFDKAAKELSSRNFTDGADLENTMIFGLLQQNQSKFIDHAWPKLPHLRDKMMEHLIIRKSVGRNGKENQYMAFKAKRGDIADRLASAKALVKIVQDHQHEFAMANERNGKRYGLERQIIKRKTGSESEFVEIMNPEDLQTYVKDVNVPELLIDLTPVLDRESHEAANSGQSSAPEQVPPDPSLFMFSTVASNMNWEIRRELASRAVEYYRRVFGDRFVDGRLDFKPSININGIDAYGVMSNAHITLQVNEEGFVSGIERHEAMHYVMLHLLDEASASDLLRQAKKEIAKANGSDSWMIDDRTAHEWLATQYQLNAPQENSLIDRFFRWLRSALRRWGLYKWRINDLMMAIEDGQFKDQHPITSKQDAPYFAEIADDKPSPLAPSRAKTLGSAASLSAAFGSPAHARSVIASVASALVRFGPYAPMYANEPVGRAVPRLKEVINQVHELYKKQAEKEPVLRNGDQKIEWSSLSQEEIRSLEPSVYRGYVASQLSKDSVYRMVVQSVFPNIDIERFLDDKSMLTLMENESAVDTADTDMDQLDGLSGTARNNNESIRPYDRASGLARMMLENMVLINPIGMSGVESTMMADLDLLLSVGNKAAQGAFYSPDGVDPYDVLGENLKKIYEEDPDGKTGIHAYTLYKRFFDPVGTFTSNAKDLKGKPLQFFSYRYASRSRKNVISRISDDGMRGMAKQRYDYMEKALQHVANLFLDSTTATRMITEVAGSGNARSRYLRFDEGDQERMNLNARVNSMFSASGGILQMSKEFRDRFAVGLPSDVAGANITIGADGVRVGDTVLLKYTDKGPELQSKDVEVIREFFASMNYVVSDQTVKRLTEKDTSLAAELVGGWAASMHATINQLGKPLADKSIWSWRYLEDVNRKKGGFRPVMLSEVSMAGSTDMAEGAEVPLPSSLFSMNQRLARIEGSVRGSGYNRSFKTPGGEMAQADNIGTPLRRMFPSLMNSEHASAVPQKVAEQLLRKLPYLKAPGRILNPLLDANGPVRVKELIAYTGVRKFGGEESADFSRMTSIDFKFGIINAFVDGIVNNPGNQEVVVPLHVFGNRGDGELVSLQFSGKKLFNTSYGKSQSGTSTIKQLDINYEVLDPLIHDRFHSAWNLYKLSAGRWAKFFGLSGDSSSQVVSMISGAKAIDVLASPDLVSGIDYIVKGDSVIPGNALAPDAKNTHYTLENIRAIANANKAGAAELRKEIKRIFDDEIAYFKRSISGFHPSGETVAEGLFYAHHLADQWVSELVMGPSAAYKSLSDYVKRSTSPMAPGHVGNYTRVPNVAFFIDPSNDPKAFDGQAFTTPWGFVDAIEAYGGLMGDMPGKMREAVNKRVYADASMLLKFSETMVSQRLYETNPEVARIIDRSLLHLPDLHALWTSMPKENYNQFWQAAKSVMEQARKTGVQDQLIDLESSHHNGKMGMRSVTPFEDNGPMTPVPLDPRNLILQTNLDRSLDRRNQLAPFFTQLSAIMNVLDHNAMNGKIRANIELKLTELALAEFERQLDQQPGETRKEKAIALMAELGIRNAQENNELGQVIDAFTDPDGVSANNPIIRSKMFSALVTALKKNSIAPKLRGQQFTASSAYGFSRPEVSSDTDGEFAAIPVDLSSSNISDDQKRHLPKDQGRNKAGVQNNGLRGPRVEGDKYIPAEIIAPFLYEEEFLFAPGSTMSLSKQQVRDQILARLGEKAVAVFDELMTVYVTRTPASNSSSGHFATIVDFISDAGNTMFLPSELNEKTGGDNDGDQMTMITKHVIVKNGSPEIVRGDDTAQGLMNKLLDNVRDYYDDTRNAQLYMVGVGTKMIEGIAEKTYQERHPYTRKLHTPSSMFAMHEAVFDGDRLIGILANTIKAYSFLAHVHNQTIGTDAYYKVFPGHNLRMFDDNGVPLIISLSEVLNGSLDNVKLMVLGQLGINPDNVGALIGNMLLGKPLDQAVASLRDYDKFVDAVRRNRSITSDDIGSQNMMRYVANELLKLQQKAAMMKAPTKEILQQVNKLTRLLHPLFVNEAFVRLGTIVSMNTGKNIPTNDSEFLIKAHQMEHILNQPVADLLAEKPVFPQHHYVIEMAQRKPALHHLIEANVRGVIDVNNAVRSMPNVMGYLSVFNKAKEISEKTMLQMSPEIKQLRSVVLEAVGRNGHFGNDGELVWSRAFNDLMVSLNLQSLFGENQVVELPGHGEFAIGTPGGAYRFAMEFPSFFAKQLELLNNMPKDSRPRQLAKSNRFLEAIRVSGGDTPVLEAIDARRYRDPLLKDILVRDFTTLDEIFQIGSDNSMSDLIATYSIIKDRFDYNRNSLFHFLPARTVRSHSRKMDSMLNILQAGTEENQLDDVIVAKTPTESVSYANLLEYLREQAPAAYPELAKVISTNQDPTYFQVARNFARVEGGWKTFVWRPVESSEQDKKKSDIEVIAVSGWNVAPMLRPEPNVYPANTLLNNIGVANYEQLMRGEEVVVSARSWVSPPPESVTQFTLPTGHVAIVKSRSSENLTIVVPGLVQDTNENEDASILPMIMPASQEEMDASLINGQTRYGKNSVDLDQQSITGALELVSRRSPSPFYREMAGLIAPLLQNSGVSTSVRSMSGYGRYRIGSPVVSFGVDNNQLDMDQAVIHEALHVLTARAIEGLDTSSAAKLYKAQMDGLLERYKLNPASKAFAHYTTNTHEFVAGVMSDPSFQHHLNNLSEQGGSFWNRLVNTLRRFISALFPSFKYARNAYVGMVMEATLRYGRDVAFSPGDPRRGQVLYMSTASASGHGMGASHKPIKDIVDIRSRLQTSKKSSRTAEEASIEDQVTNIYRNVMRRNRRVQRIGSVEFSIEGMTEGEAINYIRENVVPMLKQYEDRRKDDVVRTLNEASGSINEVADAWMERFVDRKGRPIDRREDVLRLLGAMGHTNDTKYVRYSSLAKGGSIRHKGTDIAVDQLGVKHVPLFEGHDPIVAITSGQNPTVRLFDITSKSVDYMPRVSGGKTNHLLRNYVGGSMMGSVHGIYYGNDEGGVRSLTLAMQTMALKKANPSLSFERVKVLSMNANGFTSMAVSMPDMVDVIKTIKKTALFGELPTEIRNIVGDESLLDPLIYRQSMIDLYGELLMNRSTNLDKETYEWMENERIKNAYERERSSMLSSPKGLYHMMLNRLNQLSAMNARDGEEYKLLSAALYELGNQDVSGSNTWTDLSVLAKLLTNTNHIENDVVQWVVREVQNNEAAIVEKSRKEWLEHVAMIKDLDSVIRQINPIVSGDKVVEVGWKRFERLFRKSKSEPGGKGIAVYNEAGELVRMNLPMLHWDRNDEETAELLRTGELTEAELTYANKVLDHIYEKMVELQIHELKQTNNSEVRDQETGAFVESAARVLAERHVSSHWNRGWIPIVTKSGGEQITQGRVKQFAKGIGRSASNYDALVDSEYFVDRNEVSVEQGSVPNPYYAEMDSINPFSVGGETRLRRLGLRGEADGSLVLVDPAMSNQFSFNMERIMKHFDLLANRQIIHEGKSMPVMGAAVAYLKAREEQTGMSNARVLDWLDNWARRKIIAKNPDPDPVTAHGLNIAPLANGLVTLGTYGGVALNMKVAAASLIYNQMSSFATAAAASLSGSDLFGLKEWGQAVSVCVGTKEGNEKMRALMQKLFVNEMQEGDFLNDERGRFNKTGSRVFTSHNLQAMNWVTDYFTRGIVMAAQMMKEGSWDAYSMKDGEVSYNKYLDRRFYNADGSMTKDGKRMMDWLVRKLDEQGVNPLVNGELPVGHDLNMGRSFKWIADKYVIGGMDSSQRVMLDSYWYGKILMQFRKFLPAKFYNWHGKRMKTDEGGRLVVKNDVAVWEKREIESYIAALLRTVRTMRDKRSLDIKTIYKEMDQADRFALARMGADLMVAATMLAIYMGLVSLGDDDDKKEKKKRSPLMRYLLYSDRTVRLFQQGAFDTFQGNLIGFAYQTGQNQNPIPMLSQANHMISALFGDVDQIVRVLPANADVREIMTAVEKWERDNPQELAEN